MSKITNFLTTIVAVLLFISIAPSLIIKIKSQYKTMLEPHVNVAIIKVGGTLMETEDYIKQLKRNFEDKSVKAILLEIDCGGGAAGSSQAIFNEINTLKKEYPKPIVALTINMCASGAYYIAATADHIIATPSAIVGSIGSLIGYFNIEKLMKKYDVAYIEKHAGQYKTIISPFILPTEENQKMLQGLTDNVYEQFTKDIATSRKLSLKDVNEWGNGKIFTGSQALQIGLIDEVGSKCNAIQKIRELALIKKEEKINWLEEKTPNAIEKFLQGNASNKISLDNITNAVVGKLQSGCISVN